MERFPVITPDPLLSGVSPVATPPQIQRFTVTRFVIEDIGLGSYQQTHCVVLGNLCLTFGC